MLVVLGLLVCCVFSCLRVGISVLCGIFIKKYADCVNAKYAAEIRYRIA